MASLCQGDPIDVYLSIMYVQSCPFVCLLNVSLNLFLILLFVKCLKTNWTNNLLLTDKQLSLYFKGQQDTRQNNRQIDKKLDTVTD